MTHCVISCSNMFLFKMWVMCSRLDTQLWSQLEGVQWLVQAMTPTWARAHGRTRSSSWMIQSQEVCSLKTHFFLTMTRRKSIQSQLKRCTRPVLGMTQHLYVRYLREGSLKKRPWSWTSTAGWEEAHFPFDYTMTCTNLYVCKKYIQQHMKDETFEFSDVFLPCSLSEWADVGCGPRFCGYCHPAAQMSIYRHQPSRQWWQYSPHDCCPGRYVWNTLYSIKQWIQLSKHVSFNNLTEFLIQASSPFWTTSLTTTLEWTLRSGIPVASQPSSRQVYRAERTVCLPC